jgi:hypothetical protein
MLLEVAVLLARLDAQDGTWAGGKDQIGCGGEIYILSFCVYYDAVLYK